MTNDDDDESDVDNVIQCMLDSLLIDLSAYPSADAALALDFLEGQFPYPDAINLDDISFGEGCEGNVE